MSASCVRRAGRPPLPDASRTHSSRTRAVRSMASSESTLRWLTVSKVRSDSISLPNSSTRTGRAQSVAKRSRMPPRRANVPGEPMASAGSQPRATSQSATSAGSSLPPTVRRRVLASISRGSASGNRRAWMVVTMIRGCSVGGPISRLTKASRSAAVGSVAEVASQKSSNAGRRETGNCVNKLRSSRKKSASAAWGSTTTTRPVPSVPSTNACVRAAAVSADADPQVPPIVPPCPARRLATTSANPLCVSSVSARPSNRPAGPETVESDTHNSVMKTRAGSPLHEKHDFLSPRRADARPWPVSWQTQFAGAAHGILPCNPGGRG